jgi:hypothetical protein
MHVDGEHLVPQLGRAVFHLRSPDRRAGVVEQDVGPAGLGDEPVHEGVGLGRLA